MSNALTLVRTPAARLLDLENGARRGRLPSKRARVMSHCHLTADTASRGEALDASAEGRDQHSYLTEASMPG